jgi:hypothetical protein
VTYEHNREQSEKETPEMRNKKAGGENVCIVSK